MRAIFLAAASAAVLTIGACTQGRVRAPAEVLAPTTVAFRAPAPERSPAPSPPPMPTPPSDAPVTQVAVGVAHTCVLHTDGAVSCVGANTLGQLGDGTTLTRWMPVRVVALEGAVELVAEENTTCARLAGGDVRCWGEAEADEPLGRVSSATYTVHVDGAVQITVGCARTDRGEVMCWDSHGKVEPVPFVHDAIHLASDSENPRGSWCAAVRNGDVLCWNPRTSQPPTTLRGLGAVEVGVGERFSCARTAKGAVLCWGNNHAGQLGRTTVMQPPPDLRAKAPVFGPWFPPGPVAGIATADALHVDRGGGCARLAGGKLRCWGRQREVESEASWRADGFDLRDASFPVWGRWGIHACAVAKTGDVWCRGANDNGQLGLGWSIQQPRSTEVPGISDAEEVVTLYGYTCARRRSGGVACWGRALVGRMVDDVQARGFRRPDAHPLPFDVPGFADVVELTGSVELCARTAAGAALCARPPGFAPPHVLALPRVAGLSVATTYGCATTPDAARSFCWGSPAYGEFDLADGTPTRGVVTTLPPGPAFPGIDDARKVVAGMFHSCVLRGAGELACFGSFPGTDWRPPDLHEVTSVAVGLGSVCALRADGHVWCWGGNKEGELGDGTLLSRPEPAVVPGLDHVVAVAGGGTTFCAVEQDGKLLCWGSSRWGLTGEAAAYPSQTTPVTLPGLGHVRQVSVEDAHACAVLEDGHVRCWGDVTAGQPGMYASAWQPVPQRMRVGASHAAR